MPCGILAKEQVWFEKFWLFAVAVLALSSGFFGTGVWQASALFAKARKKHRLLFIALPIYQHMYTDKIYM